MPGATKYERRLVKIRVTLTMSAFALIGGVYLIRHFLGS
jgi:hypothetical protein